MGNTDGLTSRFVLSLSKDGKSTIKRPHRSLAENGAQRGRVLHTLSHILSALFLKISAEGHLRSGHQVKSSDPTSENICDCAVATVLKGSTSDFQELTMVSVLTKRISRNFDFSDLSSGQFSDQTILWQWENVQMLFIPKLRRDLVNYIKIANYIKTIVRGTVKVM